MTRFLALVVVLFGSTLPTQAQQLITEMSTDTVQITSSLDGERLTFYGTTAPEAGSTERLMQGPFQVVIVVLGPTQDLVTRQNTNNFGIWLNTEQVQFFSFPSYFHVLSSQRLLGISNTAILHRNRIIPESYAVTLNSAGFKKTITFGRVLIRLMSEKGLFGVQESGVQFLSDTFYSAQLRLPSNAPPGPYTAQTQAGLVGCYLNVRPVRQGAPVKSPK